MLVSVKNCTPTYMENHVEELRKEVPPPKARASSHEAILKWFSSKKRGTVLDIPAGYGHLSVRLNNMGFTPTCAEIQPEIISAPGLYTMYSDLNRHIDASDSAFDYVACVEGLEHTTDPYQAVKEISRVLKPGGYAVFSLPNYTNLERRIRFLLTGAVLLPVSDEKLKKCGNSLYELHNSPLTITFLELMFRIEGLFIHEIRCDKLKKRLNLFFPLVKFMSIVINLMSKESCKKYRFDLTLAPEVILGGNCIIIIAQKKQ